MPEIDSFECDEVKSADVILVDIIGVGKNLGFKDQGYELAEALKETYPDKKIIIYSQEKNNFHKAIKKVDLTIEKTSNIYLLEKEILSLFGVHNDWYFISFSFKKRRRNTYWYLAYRAWKNN
nr:hypothetical protein [Providencia stuartii]